MLNNISQKGGFLMKLISSPNHFNDEILRLMNKYNEYYWAVAWASDKPLAFSKLKKNKHKIKQIIVGLHFYQTNPFFIQEFMNIEQVKYIKQVSGIFHPKLYLFKNSNNEFEILIGSGNFTKQAFENNTEINILLSNKDNGSETIFHESLSEINKYWNESELFTENELKNYMQAWKRLGSKRNSLSGKYGSTEESKTTLFQIPILNLDWKTYVTKVQNEKKRSIKDRFAVLEKANKLFTNSINFEQMTLNERKAIAATYHDDKSVLDDDINWKWFGSMKGSGYFKQRIINNDKNISIALDQIPMNTEVKKLHFEKYIKHFIKSDKGEAKNPLGTATRLLTLKRPDIFVCIDSKNKSNLCNSFSINASKLNIENYWDEVIERIFDSEWYKSSEPMNELERKIDKYKSALLDCLFYEK
jgi:HKD family nuclease